MITDEFEREVAPETDSPHHFKHSFQLRTGLGRVTHFSYDALTQPNIIAPHYGNGAQVIACTQHSVTVQVNDPTLNAAADLWDVGHLFTTHADHFPCPANDGSKATPGMPTYRKVTGITVSSDANGIRAYALDTVPASFVDFFETLSLELHSSHLLHKDSSPIDASARRLSSDVATKTTPTTENTKHRSLHTRRLLSTQQDSKDGHKKAGRRRLGLKKWWKKHIAKPIKKCAKAIHCGVCKCCRKDHDDRRRQLRGGDDSTPKHEGIFSTNWNYNDMTTEAIDKKIIMDDGGAVCSNCLLSSDGSYAIYMNIQHGQLQSALLDVNQDIHQMQLEMSHISTVKDVNKLLNVYSEALFMNNKFYLGCISASFSASFAVDLGLQSTAIKTGATPTDDAASTCQDVPGWHTTTDGDAFTCSDYEKYGWCLNGEKGPNFPPGTIFDPGTGGKTAQQACCACYSSTKVPAISASWKGSLNYGSKYENGQWSPVHSHALKLTKVSSQGGTTEVDAHLRMNLVSWIFYNCLELLIESEYKSRLVGTELSCSSFTCTFFSSFEPIP